MSLIYYLDDVVDCADASWWSDHYTVEAEDSEESGDDASMPPLGHGYDSDETDTTVSTASDETMERY